MSGDRTLTVQMLLASGFVEVACWNVDDRGLVAPRDVPGKAGVYAFALEELVQYVGLASVSILQRFGFYARPGATQSTNIRLNTLIRELIAAGHTVRVLVAHPEDGRWNGLRISGPEGLEAALIKDFDLPWNKRAASVVLPPPVIEDRSTDKRASTTAPTRPNGALAVRRAIIEHVAKYPGCTEREIAQALFGRSGVQQQVNGHCRELVQTGRLQRLPTSPLTYRLGRNARFD